MGEGDIMRKRSSGAHTGAGHTTLLLLLCGSAMLSPDLWSEGASRVAASNPLESFVSRLAIPEPSLKIAVSTALLNGDAREYVYRQDDVLSELVWPLETVTELGLDTAVAWDGALSLDLSVKADLPKRAGTLTDSDFKNIPKNAVKTNYSEHDAYLEEGLGFSAGASWNFRLPVSGPATERRITLAPRLGIRYQRFAWKGTNGWNRYGACYDTDGDGVADRYDEWSANPVATAMTGTVITYRQEYTIPVVGASVVIPVGTPFDVCLGVSASPFVSGVGYDYHVVTSWEFIDVLSGGYFVEPSLAMGWRATSLLRVFIDGRWTVILGARGDTYSKHVNSTNYFLTTKSSGGGGGGSYGAVSARLGFELLTGGSQR